MNDRRNNSSIYEFVNPYNFIPLEAEKSVAAADCDEKKYSGVIEYSLLTKTPLFIPNTSNDNAFGSTVEDHKTYDFFSYNDLSGKNVKGQCFEPVIPGSEIRGMFRSNYEALTNSCLFLVDTDAVLSKRTAETFKAGLLKKTEKGYDLYAAEDVIYRNGNYTYRTKEFAEGQKVYITIQKDDNNRHGKAHVVDIRKQSFDGSRVGYVIKGEKSPGGRNEKKNMHIFCAGGKRVKENVSTNVLSQVLKEYNTNNKDSYEEYGTQWKNFTKSEVGSAFPVYYSFIDNEIAQNSYIMLSPACITREIYQNTLGGIVRTHKKCNDSNKLCPACKLFGTLEKNFSRVSKVRFTDLAYAGDKTFNSIYENIVTLEPLSSPKINNMEFYFKRPSEKAWFWTCDYWIDGRGNVTKYIPEINGRKFYWHQLDMKINSVEASNQNISIRPLKSNVKFIGKLYFDEISKKELDMLIYLVKAGDEQALADKKHGYKLGNAKPLGYGSIATAVDKVVIRELISDEAGKKIVFAEEEYLTYETPVIASQTEVNYEKMTRFHYVSGIKVSYPRKRSDEDIFKWFGQNHKSYRYDYKEHKNYIIGNPNSRKQMAYVEYMEAMSAELKKTSFKAEQRQKK